MPMVKSNAAVVLVAPTAPPIESVFVVLPAIVFPSALANQSTTAYAFP